jgi:tetratricopeptide (TPR) repeat protein
MSIGKPGAKNAAILAAEILALSRPDLRQRLRDYKEALERSVEEKDRELAVTQEEALIEIYKPVLNWMMPRRNFAMWSFSALLIVGAGLPPAQWAERELRKIMGEGMKKLAEAKIAADDKDYLKAMTLLEELTREYPGTSIGSDAARLMKELVKEPEAAKALHEALRLRRAMRLLNRAKELEGRKSFEEALILYWDVSRDYSDTPAAAEAAGRAAALAADEELAKRAVKTRTERDCRLWMEMAKAFADNKKIDKAVEYYRKVITLYGDTPYAQKAREAIVYYEVLAPPKCFRRDADMWEL